MTTRARTRAAPASLMHLAELGLTAGVNLQPGQELIVTAPVEASPLVRQLAESAYRHGARLVTCLYEDPDALRARLRYGDSHALDAAPRWLFEGVTKALRGGAARLSVLGPYPDLLAGVSLDRIGRAHIALHEASAAERRLLSEARVNSTVIPFATTSWATTVFPQIAPASARRRLWKALLAAVRANEPDPVASARRHVRALDARRSALQARGLSALRFHDGRTDLTVGLVNGHRWAGGTVVATNGVAHLPSIPAEELYTCVRRDSANGRMVLSRPIMLAGTRIDGARIEFRGGTIVSVAATTGRRTLERFLALDPDAGRLGEVGLAPTRTSMAGIASFHVPALDRNAASHIAFGRPGLACLPRREKGGGANRSAFHVDCPVGNPAMNVDGIHPCGRIEPIMRNGSFTL